MSQFMMSIEQERNLTAEECDELAEALRHDAAALPDDLKKANLLELAECYRDLAQMKRLVLRKVS
jgi:NTP pyrophosphatase (non-canonical NTP hydrolase)